MKGYFTFLFGQFRRRLAKCMGISMITISLCMIVKNEETILARCLDSICDLMDEIIIIDTGSTDQTKEIAKKYTNHIFDFEWCDDFSAARNFSFSKATKEYIYVADADEVLDAENQKKFQQLKQVLLPEIEIVQMKYCNQLQFNTTYNFDEEYRPKLYKRLREYVWMEPIHEEVNLEPVIYDSDIKILHMPQSNHGHRDFSLFQRMIKEGKRISKRLHNMYARELFIAGNKEDFLEAKVFFKHSIEESRTIDEIKEAACILTRVFRLEKDFANMFRYALKDMITTPCAEICFELGQYYQKDVLDWKEASIWYYNAAFEAESILDIHCGGDFAFDALALCCMHLSNEEEREKRIKEAGEYKELEEEYKKLSEEWKGKRK